MKSKKDVSGLKEDLRFESVKLHKYRFSKFLRYLKDHKVKLTITREDEEGDPVEFTYRYRSGNGYSSIKALVAEILNVSENTVNEYFRTKLGLDDYHANADSTRNMGSRIEGLYFYLNSDGLVYERNNRLNKNLPFAPMRSFLHNYYLTERKLKNKSKISNFHQFDSDFTDDYLEKEINQFDGIFKVAQEVYENELFPIECMTKNFTYPLLKQLIDTETGQLDMKVWQEVEKPLQILKEKYWVEYERTYPLQLLPNYPSLEIPTSKKLSQIIIKNYSDDLLDKIERKRVSNTELIQYRYEILWFLFTTTINTSVWEKEWKALLLLVIEELFAVRLFFKIASERIVNDLRFIVFTSGDGAKKQFDSLNINDLANVLTDYDFDIDKMVEGANLKYSILKTNLIKFPEPDAVKPFNSISDIETMLFSYFSEYFFGKVAEGFGVQENFYEYSEI